MADIYDENIYILSPMDKVEIVGLRKGRESDSSSVKICSRDGTNWLLVIAEPGALVLLSYHDHSMDGNTDE